MIEITKLQIFIIAAETCNFNEAAKQLHLSQPTISHHIKTLERDLGVTLFHRAGPKITLTETGRLLLPNARKLIRQSIELEELMGSTRENVAGHLRIACSTTAGKYILPQLAARFCQRFPSIHVSILACTTENVVSQLLENEANLAVISSEKFDIGIEAQEFFTDHIELIVPSDHPWASRPFIELPELLEEPIIIREITAGTRRVLLEELAKHDFALDDLNILLELGNAEAIVYTVAAGYGVAFVSTLATSYPLKLGCVTTVPVENLELRRKIYMIRKQIRTNQQTQEVFWGFIHDPMNSDLIRLPETR